MKQNTRCGANGKTFRVIIIPVLFLLGYGGHALYAQTAEGTAPQRSAAANKSPNLQKFARQIDLLARKVEAGTPDYEGIKKLANDLIPLTADQLNKLFLPALAKHPRSANELKVCWASVLSSKNLCAKAMAKIKGVPAFSDTFFQGVKDQVAQQCGAK
jgi:hypothetical protein